MKATGIVRRIDDLGRVVIPKEIRRTMRIREGDPWRFTPAGRRGGFFSASTNSPLKPRRLSLRSGWRTMHSPCVPHPLSSASRTKPPLARWSAITAVGLERQPLRQKIFLSPLSVWLSPFAEPLAELFRRNCLRTKKIA